MGVFWSSALAMLDALIKIFLIGVLAAYMVKKQLISDQDIKSLSDLTIKVFLPALTFEKVLTTFKPYETDGWWILPLVGLLFPILFLGITALFYLPNVKPHLNKLPIASLQNVGYLVLPIGQILYPQQFDQFALYVFLLTIGFSISLWTVGKFLISYQIGKTELKLAELITPPFVAIILAIALVFMRLDRYFPKLILEPIALLGQAAIPVATFILGATIGTISLKRLPKVVDILKLSFVKYVLMPGLAVLILKFTGLGKSNPLLASMLVIEASAAPAANLIVIVQKYGGNAWLTASLMLIMYLLAIIFMPLWIGIWQII